MTWELAESGNDFITSVINGADLVPTFSAASVDDLRAEVTFSKLFRISIYFLFLVPNLLTSEDYLADIFYACILCGRIYDLCLLKLF